MKKDENEKKLKALEETKADALEMAAQKDEKGKAKKTLQGQVKSPIVLLFLTGQEGLES